MITEQQLERLYSECMKLPATSVREEESHVYGKPLLIAMSTVLSLNRKWYSHVLPARRRFEKGPYAYLIDEPLSEFVAKANELIGKMADWRLLSNALWENREWQKAQQLTRLSDYLSRWCRRFHPEDPEMTAIEKWAATVPKEQFLGKIKGLGPRAHEQLLWYIEGSNAIKFDRHVTNFISMCLGPAITESDAIEALEIVAKRMGTTATMLDARIWNYMQGRNNP